VYISVISIKIKTSRETSRLFEKKKLFAMSYHDVIHVHMRDANEGNMPWNNFSPIVNIIKRYKKKKTTVQPWKGRPVYGAWIYFCKFLFDVSAPSRISAARVISRVESHANYFLAHFCIEYTGNIFARVIDEFTYLRFAVAANEPLRQNSSITIIDKSKHDLGILYCVSYRETREIIFFFNSI